MANTDTRWSTKSKSDITYRLVKIEGDVISGFRGRPSVTLDAIKSRLLKMRTDSAGRYNASKARNVHVQKLVHGVVQEMIQIDDPRI